MAPGSGPGQGSDPSHPAFALCLRLPNWPSRSQSATSVGVSTIPVGISTVCRRTICLLQYPAGMCQRACFREGTCCALHAITATRTNQSRRDDIPGTEDDVWISLSKMSAQDNVACRLLYIHRADVWVLLGRFYASCRARLNLGAPA
jgi:hypothetical protein